MKTITVYLLYLCSLLLWPLSGKASVELQAISVLPDSFANCATAETTSQPFHWQEIQANESYCLAIDVNLLNQNVEAPPNSISLLISALGSSRLFLNGRLIGSNGLPALTAKNEIPGQIEFLYPLPLTGLKPGTHQLRLQLSTHNAPSDFFQYLYAIQVMDTQSFLHERQQQHFITLLLCGALVMAAILIATLGLTLGRRKHWLVFGFLAIVTAGLLLAESWRSLFGYLYTAHLLRLQIIWWLALLFSVLLPVYFLLLYRFVLHRFLYAVCTILFVTSYFLPLSQDGKVLLLMAMSLLLSTLITIAGVYRQRTSSYFGLMIILVATGLCAYRYWYFAEQGFVWIVLLLMLLLLYQLVSQWMKDQHKAELAMQLENQLLRKSLQPHFLMNCLELVNELQREDPAQAEQFIQALSEEFRLLNQYASQQLIPVEQELHLCRNYLQLMAIRLQQTHHLDIAGNYQGVCLPPATLLVLLENAFSHNKYENGQVFSVQFHHEKGGVVIKVKLPLGSKRVHQGSGTGTAYLQQSLHNAFAGKEKMSSAIDQDCWSVSIELPV